MGNSIDINEWIIQQEGREDLSIEEFYQVLASALQSIQERLECAPDDGVDL